MYCQPAMQCRAGGTCCSYLQSLILRHHDKVESTGHRNEKGRPDFRPATARKHRQPVSQFHRRSGEAESTFRNFAQTSDILGASRPHLGRQLSGWSIASKRKGPEQGISGVAHYGPRGTGRIGSERHGGPASWNWHVGARAYQAHPDSRAHIRSSCPHRRCRTFDQG